ncbi:zinc-dependent alcohol dehydrogenase family protein [Ornithinimicrobium humiphilum]|uniref:Threonine dehydrogenase-like Zn-dependent dehydrogenase n=1 Tax=Ornithinimicrobium humiphilum TaxID=125288 RepID=A0A543K7V7_9MICO|nr:zinc-dependent alcohol dehydrogenase family protein [Ornithinimicrobium humiphilum]TQM91155.1 threonine dehydrogenase-like Zn-dependent dehydrogenase [Ornithinimicrobium humiphilum]
MRATILHATRDIRLEEVPDPTILRPTDAIVRVTATCVCGSDLWPYRGINEVRSPRAIGHEMVGIVEEVGPEVRTVRPGQFVIAPFRYSCGECAHCRAGVHTSCVRGGQGWGGLDGDGEPTPACQGEIVRVPFADGTLVATPEVPDDAMLPSMLALSDVMATGWHCAVAAGVQPGETVVVVGDGAVGLSAVLAASRLGAGRVVAMSRHEPRQAVAREFGATDVVAERGDEGAERIRELTDGVGADRVLECVGTGDSMSQAFASARPGGTVGFVGVPHGVEVPIGTMFRSNIGLAGGVAPVRAYLEQLRDDVLAGEIDPGKVFDLTLPLDQVAEAYAAMDERRAIKVMLRP